MEEKNNDSKTEVSQTSVVVEKPGNDKAVIETVFMPGSSKTTEGASEGATEGASGEPATTAVREGFWSDKKRLIKVVMIPVVSVLFIELLNGDRTGRVMARFIGNPSIARVVRLVVGAVFIFLLLIVAKYF